MDGSDLANFSSERLTTHAVTKSQRRDAFEVSSVGIFWDGRLGNTLDFASVTSAGDDPDDVRRRDQRRKSGRAPLRIRERTYPAVCATVRSGETECVRYAGDARVEKP